MRVRLTSLWVTSYKPIKEGAQRVSTDDEYWKLMNAFTVPSRREADRRIDELMERDVASGMTDLVYETHRALIVGGMIIGRTR